MIDEAQWLLRILIAMSGRNTFTRGRKSNGGLTLQEEVMDVDFRKMWRRKRRSGKKGICDAFIKIVKHNKEKEKARERGNVGIPLVGRLLCDEAYMGCRIHERKNKNNLRSNIGLLCTPEISVWFVA